MIEKELKILLTREEYFALRPPENPYTQPFTQKNYYFDTTDYAMDNLGITCRIREKNGKYTTTIKAHDKKNTNCSIEINDEPKNTPDVSLFRDLNLKAQGYMVTERIILSSFDGFEVAIDQNTYLGVTDYELEVEYADDKKHYAKNMVQTFNTCIRTKLKNNFDSIDFINRTNKSSSKSARFFKRKKAIMNKP